MEPYPDPPDAHPSAGPPTTRRYVVDSPHSVDQNPHMATGTTPGVRRRGPSKGDRTSQAILDTAERLLAERDLSAITIDELATGAGISRSAFYFHFESREAVLYLLADRVLKELFESAEVATSRR